jgi:hypothetical protein
MHTQHVKFCVYVGGGGVLIFVEGEVSEMVAADVDGLVFEVVVVVVVFLPSPSFCFFLFDIVCTNKTSCYKTRGVSGGQTPR